MSGAAPAGPVTRIADAVTLAYGWRRAAIALVAGAAGALAMPPLGLWPVFALSFPVAIWLVDGAACGGRFGWRSARAAAFAGWAFGFGYFVAGLWWLGAAFLVEADRFALLMPLGVLGLPAALAFFPAAGFAAARLVWPAGAARILVFAAAMAVSEWLRGAVFTGFPWNAYGMAFGQAFPLDQAAAVAGLHGLTLAVLLILAAPAALGDRAEARWRPPALAALALALMAAWGWARVPAGPAATVAGVKLRIMQPDVPQDSRFRPEARERVLAHYLALSDRATSPAAGGIADVTHLIWPESAFPFILDRDAAALQRLAAFLPDGVTLVTGAARADTMLPGETRPRFFNAIQVIDGGGRVTATYDKTHLVPFGEYLPLAGLLDSLGLRQFVAVPGGFTHGRTRGPLPVPGWPRTAPLICYEAIFPAEAASGVGRAEVLLNVTNDAWFGLTPGPAQHFAQARLRAIEQGAPLVRAANNGISAVVDPWGRIVASLPLGATGVLDAPLPAASAHTIYARFRDVVFAVLVALVLLVAFGVCRFSHRGGGRGATR